MSGLPTVDRSVPAKTLLFFSGLAALIYQTIWIKQLTLVVGVDVYAVATGVSGFFAGLALGSAALGRLADRSPNPIKMYASPSSPVSPPFLPLSEGGALQPYVVCSRISAED